jgi:hypothetical protein
MSKRNSTREFRIELTKIDGKNSGRLESLSVPQHQIDEGRLQSLANSLLTKHTGLQSEELLPFFVNGRKGKITRSTSWDLTQFVDPEKAETGYYCAFPPYYFVARQSISKNESAAYKLIIEQNKRTANV